MPKRIWFWQIWSHIIISLYSAILFPNNSFIAIMLVNILLFQHYSCQICNLLYYYSQYYASIIGSGLLFAAIFGLTPINTAIHWKKSYISSTTIYKGHAKDRSNFLYMLGTCRDEPILLLFSPIFLFTYFSFCNSFIFSLLCSLFCSKLNILLKV